MTDEILVGITEEQAIQKGSEGKDRRSVAVSRTMSRQNTEERKGHGRNENKKLKLRYPR